MLSYRHSFHAGNHADVLKHLVSSLIIESLKQKDSPFVYIDTHSGAGRYCLSDEWSEKTGEYKDGIAKLWANRAQLESDFPQLAEYFKAIDAVNAPSVSDPYLEYYPGSPRVAKALLRREDRMVLTELHPKDHELLCQEFGRDRRVKISKEDGFSRLKACVPPLERRGMVLIDPPYELSHEYQDVVNALCDSHKRWATGIYALWYPVVLRETIVQLESRLKNLGIKKILKIELGISQDTDKHGMTASGMIVINPPWKLYEQMQTLLPCLKDVLAPTSGHTTLEWLVTE